VFIPFEWTKSLSMRLPVALQSRRASTECSSLVSVVPISTGRSRKVPHASKALIERSLGSLFSHLGLRSDVMPYKHLGKISDILHLNNKNNQLKRRARPPKDVPLDVQSWT